MNHYFITLLCVFFLGATTRPLSINHVLEGEAAEAILTPISVPRYLGDAAQSVLHKSKHEAALRNRNACEAHKS
jgi:hypothetical protein